MRYQVEIDFQPVSHHRVFGAAARALAPYILRRKALPQHGRGFNHTTFAIRDTSDNTLYSKTGNRIDEATLGRVLHIRPDTEGGFPA